MLQKSNILITIIASLFGISSASNLDISPNDPIIPVLRRAQTRGVAVLSSQNFPQTVNDLDLFLRKSDLSMYDRAYLHTRFPMGDTPLINYSDTMTGKTLSLSPLMRVTTYDTSKVGLIGSLGMRVFGNLGPYLTYFTQGEVFTEWTNVDQFSHQFDPDKGESCSVEKGPNDGLLSSRTCNRFIYYSRLNLKWIQIKAGRDHIHMGPGYFSSLTAQKQTAPYYLLETRIPFSDWFYLDNYFLKMTDSDHAVRKFAHIHRFEFKPVTSLSIAFQDAVIYQERNIDLAYMLPLIPLAFSEDNTGGRDNDAMAFDVLYSGVPYMSVWGELFIDDLLGPGTFFDDFWENRWSFLFGFQLISPFVWMDADVIFEYSRVEPWTYNGRDNYTSFKHFNRPSASKLGPDARTLDLLLSYRPLKLIEISHRLELNDKGTQAGAKLGNIHNNDKHGTKKKFLDGDTIKDRVSTISITTYWKQYILFSGFCGFDWLEKEIQDLGATLSLSW